MVNSNLFNKLINRNPNKKSIPVEYDPKKEAEEILKKLLSSSDHCNRPSDIEEALSILQNIFNEKIPENEIISRTNALCLMLVAGRLSNFEPEIKKLATIALRLCHRGGK